MTQLSKLQRAWCFGGSPSEDLDGFQSNEGNSGQPPSIEV
jgi:hypothetical protein